jgi:hypothetical protein
MVVFRQVDEPYSAKGWHWNVEYFSEDPHQRMFPIGTAYVVAPPETTAAQLDFVLVADQWRKEGVARELIKACQERWPGLQYTGPMDEAGDKLLRVATDFYANDLDE